MAILIGSNAVAVGTDNFSGNSGKADRFGDTAVAGDMATFHIDFTSTSASTFVKGCLWNSSGSLVANSAAIAANIGEQSGAIAGTLTASLYHRGFVASDFVDIETTDNNTHEIFYDDTVSYASPGSHSLSTSENKANLRLWIEDAGAGGASWLNRNYFWDNM